MPCVFACFFGCFGFVLCCVFFVLFLVGLSDSRVPRGFNLIHSHLTGMLLDDRQGFTARSSARRKKKERSNGRFVSLSPCRLAGSEGVGTGGGKAGSATMTDRPSAQNSTKRGEIKGTFWSDDELKITTEDYLVFSPWPFAGRSKEGWRGGWVANTIIIRIQSLKSKLCSIQM